MNKIETHLERVGGRLRSRAKAVAPGVLTRLPGSSSRFGPPRRLVPSTAEWVECWNAEHGAADAAELIGVHEAVDIDWEPSIGPERVGVAGDATASGAAASLAARDHRPGRPTFVVTMPRGRVAGYFGSVITPDDGLLTDVSFGFVADDRRHPLRRRLSTGHLERLPGTAATIAFGHADAFYHWMFDVLPRLEILRLAGWDETRWDHLIVNASGAAYEQETLRRFGVPADRVRVVDADTQIEAERLVVPSMVGVCGDVPGWAAQILRERFLGAPPAEGAPLRLYISRADTEQRRLADEERLVPQLESLGFTCLTLSGRSLDEQIDLFSRAEIVVGPHGGGLTNLVWCRPGTAVVELYADTYVNPVFRGLSSTLGLRHHHLIGRSGRPDLPASYGAIVVEVDAVVRLVEYALNGAGPSAEQCPGSDLDPNGRIAHRGSVES
jgi:hypothetical protein